MQLLQSKLHKVMETIGSRNDKSIANIPVTFCTNKTTAYT